MTDTTTTQYIVNGERDDSAHEPFELGTVQWIRRFGEGDREQLASGFWKVSPPDAPEPFDLVSEGDESILIIEGAIRIEPAGGEAFTLRAGSSASFNSGSRSRWTILEPTVEYFVYS